MRTGRARAGWWRWSRPPIPVRRRLAMRWVFSMRIHSTFAAPTQGAGQSFPKRRCWKRRASPCRHLFQHNNFVSFRAHRDGFIDEPLARFLLAQTPTDTGTQSAGLSVAEEMQRMRSRDRSGRCCHRTASLRLNRAWPRWRRVASKLSGNVNLLGEKKNKCPAAPRAKLPRKRPVPATPLPVSASWRKVVPMGVGFHKCRGRIDMPAETKTDRGPVEPSVPTACRMLQPPCLMMMER